MRYKTIINDKSKLSDQCIEASFDDKDTESIIKSIKNLLYKDSSLIALSAPQIGYKKRIFCIKFANGDIRTFINPMITHQKGIHGSIEQNVSVVGTWLMPRFDEIEVMYQTPVAKIENNLLQGPVSEIFQQMNDLLNGVTLDDYGLEIIPEWYKATKEEQEEVIQSYLHDLKDRKETLDKEIEETPSLKEMNDAINFMTSVETGKTILEKQEEKSTLNREQRRLQKKIEKKLNKLGAH